ncbi:MAG TPA: glycosyltransferase family 4 protein [Methylotenera sp.]|nr:glycosyltransferase family 4 protein [Methylotenera sp.]HPH04669.1 glycosyltransferase family 4 protein [Methylotenera sp.]HPN01470.1 glycosyltransferase family 4 protein [Methylotenera sp.]
MKIGYLMNSYPMTSTTFIRREIEALEALGLDVHRYAVRHWGEKLVDPLDIADQARTHYLLTNNAIALITSFFSVLFSNPVGFFRGLALWFQVWRNAGSLSIKYFAYLLQATYFYKLSKQDGLQHVHVHFSTNATTVAMIAKQMGGVSYSFTAHGPDEFVDPTASSMSLKVQHAAFVAAISNYCKVLLVRFSSYEYWDKIIIVHCGLNIADFTPNYAFDAHNQSLICVGRICPQKAQLLFPPALAQLKNEFPKMKVHFIGDGESRPALEAAIKQYDVANMVVLHGWKVNSEVREMLANSRGLLLPSFAEGLPVVIMESLALGRPVISTYIAGIPELVDEQCGWLIPAGSIDGIASAIRAALTTSPEKLSAMGKEGRSRIEAEHNLATIAPKLFDAFAKVVNSK